MDEVLPTPSETVLSDPDLVFLIVSFLPARDGPRALLGVLRAAKQLRAVALRPDLPHWRACNLQTFQDLEPDLGTLAARFFRMASLVDGRQRFDCSAALRVLATKPCLTSLDLSGLKIPSQGAVSQLLEALPASLRTLAIRSDCPQPDAALGAIRRSPRLGELPNLCRLDLRGILTERTLAGLRLIRGAVSYLPQHLGEKPEGLARPLPNLEYLAVGFHTYTRIGHEEGLRYLKDQLDHSPRLQAISCSPLIGVDTLGPVDVHCGVCQRRLYANLSNYIVHPPQQPHISYELHTDEPPLSDAVTPYSEASAWASAAAADQDDTRLRCRGICHGRLWVIDAGSGYVHHILGRGYSVACGPSRGGHPALCVAVRSRGAPSTGAGSGTGSGAGAGSSTSSGSGHGPAQGSSPPMTSTAPPAEQPAPPEAAPEALGGDIFLPCLEPTHGTGEEGEV